MTVSIYVTETVTRKEILDVESFKRYIVELRFFYESYTGKCSPSFVQLLRQTNIAGILTECATIPVEMVKGVDGCDLTEWFQENYKQVFEYLSDNNSHLY